MKLRKFRKKIGLTLFIVIIGLLIGTLIGEILGIVLPEGAVKKVMTESVRVGLQSFTLDLHIITITLGFMIRINLLGIIGVLVLGYILKWLY